MLQVFTNLDFIGVCCCGFKVEHSYLNSFDGFVHSLKTMLLQMSLLATGAPTGNHGLYHRYNIEAITLHGVKLRNSRVAFDFTDIGR